MAACHHIAPERYVHPDDPAGWLKPYEPLMVDGLDWSWAFVWHKPVPGRDDYCVGFDGSFWSQRRHWGRISSDWLRRSGTQKHAGHICVSMSDGHEKVLRSLHVLVLEAFVGPAPPGMWCRHLNGVPWDNRLDNLRWGTPKENSADARRRGTLPIGSKVSSAKLDEPKVARILERLRRGEGKARIATEYGVRIGTIDFIARGETWRHVFEATGAKPVDYRRPVSRCLSPEELGEAKRLRARGVLQRVIAQRFGMTQAGISRLFRAIDSRERSRDRR
jgi:hypothetical protein